MFSTQNASDIDPFIRQWWRLLSKAPTCALGAVGCSVSCSRTLRQGIELSTFWLLNDLFTSCTTVAPTKKANTRNTRRTLLVFYWLVAVVVVFIVASKSSGDTLANSKRKQHMRPCVNPNLKRQKESIRQVEKWRWHLAFYMVFF